MKKIAYNNSLTGHKTLKILSDSHSSTFNTNEYRRCNTIYKYYICY